MGVRIVSIEQESDGSYSCDFRFIDEEERREDAVPNQDKERVRGQETTDNEQEMTDS